MTKCENPCPYGKFDGCCHFCPDRASCADACPENPEKCGQAKFDEEAYAFYTGQILLEARREAKVTQSELAKRINATKSYISRIENGSINPSVGTFYRIMNALGLRVEIVKPLA